MPIMHIAGWKHLSGRQLRTDGTDGVSAPERKEVRSGEGVEGPGPTDGGTPVRGRTH